VKVLITGGLGYIGSHLIRFLSDALGYQVRILDLNIPPEFEDWKKKYEIIQSDITKKDEISRCCLGCDAVIHLAALDKTKSHQDPELALKVSGIGTRNILEEAAGCNVQQFIYFSTIHVYGIPRKRRIDENIPVNPLNDYSIAHYTGELYCQQFRELFNLKAIRIRLSNGYGAPVKKNINCWSIVVHDFCQSAFQQKKILLKSEGTQKRDFISIPDILQAVQLLLEAEKSKIKYDLYNVGSGVSFSIKEIAHLVKDVYEESYGKKVKIEFAPDLISADFKIPFVLDISRIKEIGFFPKGPETMDKEIKKIFTLLENN